MLAIYYLRSGAITHNQISCVSIHAVGSIGVDFSYKTSTETTDRLQFYIDGTATGPSRSGVIPLTPDTYTTALGNHTYKWCYGKDTSVSTGDEAVWLDNILIK